MSGHQPQIKAPNSAPTNQAKQSRQETRGDEPEFSILETLQLKDLQRQANAHPSTRSLDALQRRANASMVTRRLRDLNGGRETPRELKQNARPGQLDTPVAQRRRMAGSGSYSLNSSTILQRKAPPNGQVQSPAIIGAANTPIEAPQLDELGVSAASMSDADYDAWKTTLQCKRRMHGAHSANGQTIVTQYKTQSGVLQRWILSDKNKGLLLYLEGGLTLLAGSVALGVAIAAASVPGAAAISVPAIIASIMSIGVGLSKIYRGYLIRTDDPVTDTPQQVKAAAQAKATRKSRMNNLRILEALLASLGAAMVTMNPKSLLTGVSLIVFAIAKLVRAIATKMVEDDPNGASTVAGKVASVAHVIEAAALVVAGGASIGGGITGAADLAFGGGPKAAGGAAMAAVGLSKGVRATDQAGDSFGARVQAGGAQQQGAV